MPRRPGAEPAARAWPAAPPSCPARKTPGQVAAGPREAPREGHRSSREILPPRPAASAEGPVGMSIPGHSGPLPSLTQASQDRCPTPHRQHLKGFLLSALSSGSQSPSPSSRRLQGPGQPLPLPPGTPNPP